MDGGVVDFRKCPYFPLEIYIWKVLGKDSLTCTQWVITNVSTSFYAIELAPGFFRWGYAWPLHHIVQVSRQILFDLHSEIGLNIGVLFAWIAVSVALFPFCCYFMRWKQEREKRAAEKNAESYTVYDARAEGEKKHVLKERGQLPPIRKRGFMRGV